MREPTRSAAYRCCVGQSLRLHMVASSYPPSFYYFNGTNWSGYLPLLIEWLSNEMGFAYEYVGYIPTDEEAVLCTHNESKFHKLLRGDHDLEPFHWMSESPDLRTLHNIHTYMYMHMCMHMCVCVCWPVSRLRRIRPVGSRSWGAGRGAI